MKTGFIKLSLESGTFTVNVDHILYYVLKPGSKKTTIKLRSSEPEYLYATESVEEIDNLILNARTT